MATTPLRSLSKAPTFGVGTMVQLVPFQCSASVWSKPEALVVSPTDQMSVAERTDVLIRKLAPRPFGLATVWNPPSQLIEPGASGAAGAPATTVPRGPTTATDATNDRAPITRISFRNRSPLYGRRLSFKR